MNQRLAIFIVFLGLLTGCKDAPPSTVISDPIPVPPPSVHIIDTYYYSQFTWGRGKNNDTVTFEVPDYLEDREDSEYMNQVMEMRSEVILRPNELDSSMYDTVGWAYGPATILYPYDYAKSFIPIAQNQNVDEPELVIYDLPSPLIRPAEAVNEAGYLAYNEIFWMTFPWRTLDTIQYWDIQDYLANPSIIEDNVKWGRLGNNVGKDSVFNDDQRNGVVLHYIDRDGNLWESDNEPTFQPDGFFQINEITQNLRDERSYIIIEGEMAGRLYNQFGEYKELRGGKFRVKLFDDILLSEQPK